MTQAEEEENTKLRRETKGGAGLRGRDSDIGKRTSGVCGEQGKRRVLIDWLVGLLTTGSD